MIKDIPFFEDCGDGKQCAQIAMRNVLKHFYDWNVSLAELDVMTGRKEGYWTWMPQVSGALYNLGLDVRQYSKDDLSPSLNEGDIRERFGKNAEKILKHVDIPIVSGSIKRVHEYGIFERKRLFSRDLESCVDKGGIPIVWIDHNKIIGRDDCHQGHSVTFTGGEGDKVFYHDSGPNNQVKNREVDRMVFVNAWAAAGYGAILVYGER
ncbi:hypothetical protein HN903_02185 [archaeon]|jgi:hypothetical protein|nr:hypothetical protein [archaeon]MBT7128541.1 hypothetical protein [archaeon]